MDVLFIVSVDDLDWCSVRERGAVRYVGMYFLFVWASCSAFRCLSFALFVYTAVASARESYAQMEA